MLNAHNPFEMPGLPEITLFPDMDRVGRFYFIRKPHITRDEQNRQQISLLLYGRKQSGVLQCTGGQISLGTSMALLPGEEDGLRRALEKKYQVSAVELATPSWRNGKVRITLTPRFILESQPSLLGGNETVFIKELSSLEADILKEAWKKGLPDAFIFYILEAEAAEQNEISMGDRVRVELKERRAVPFPVHLEAPLRIPPGENIKFLKY